MTVNVRLATYKEDKELSNTVFNKGKEIDYTKQPMFFGEDLGTKIRQYEVSYI